MKTSANLFYQTKQTPRFLVQVSKTLCECNFLSFKCSLLNHSNLKIILVYNREAIETFERATCLSYK